MATSSENGQSAAENETLTLKSSDGDEFVVPVSAAVLSGTIKNMVEDGCAADAIPLTSVSATTKILCKIIPYLKKHAAAAAAAAAAADDLTHDELKKFDDEFVSGESVDDLLDALTVANYLEIKELIELLATTIAVLIRSYEVEEVRELFNIGEDDFLPAAEEEKIRAEYPWAFEKLDEA